MSGLISRTVPDDKRPLEILHHYRADAHLVKEHRIRMETPELSLFDKNCNELSGMALKYAKERAKREFVPGCTFVSDAHLFRIHICF